MLIISEDQFLKELADSKSESILRSEAIIKDKIKKLNNGSPNISNEVLLENTTYDNFRKPEGPNIPNELKPVIGALAALGENRDELSETFGISKDTIGNLANDNHKNAIVSERKVAIIERVKSNIVDKIDKSIEFLEVIKGTSNKELLYTAESLSRIHRNITPVSAPTEGSNVQFVFYAPERQNKVEDYTIIDAT